MGVIIAGVDPARQIYFGVKLFCCVAAKHKVTSRLSFNGRVAQLVEQLTLNQRVPGSSPGASTTGSWLFPPPKDGGKDSAPNVASKVWAYIRTMKSFG